MRRGRDPRRGRHDPRRGGQPRAVSQWAALLATGHWREVRRVPGEGRRVHLRGALVDLAREGARVVRVDSGGGLTGALLAHGLVDEISLLVHPVLAGRDGPRWYGTGPPAARLDPLEDQWLDGWLARLRYGRTGAAPAR